MKLLPTCAGTAIAGLLLAAPPVAQAASVSYDVSDTVVSSAPPQPYYVPGDPVACTTACTYAQASAADMANGWSASFSSNSPQGWPVLFTSAMPGYTNVEDSLVVSAPPAGDVFDVSMGGPLQRAAVDFSGLLLSGQQNRVSVQTWKSGSGSSQTSYAVRIAPTTSRYTYLEFTLPTQTGASDEATHLINAYEPQTTHVNRLQGRNAVDVYVDGLPVWSSESVRLWPKRYGGIPGARITQQWGPEINGDVVTLYLGRLPVGSVRTATIVFRSDVRVDAPKCWSGTYNLGDNKYNCNTELQALTLPSKVVAPYYFGRPAISVYTR